MKAAACLVFAVFALACAPTVNPTDEGGEVPTNPIILAVSAPVAPPMRLIQVADLDGDGVPDGQDVCMDIPAGQYPDVRRPGCPMADKDGDGIPDVLDMCPSVPAGAHPDPGKPGCPGEVSTPFQVSLANVAQSFGWVPAGDGSLSTSAFWDWSDNANPVPPAYLDFVVPIPQSAGPVVELWQVSVDATVDASTPSAGCAGTDVADLSQPDPSKPADRGCVRREMWLDSGPGTSPGIVDVAPLPSIHTWAATSPQGQGFGGVAAGATVAHVRLCATGTIKSLAKVQIKGVLRSHY